MHRYSRNAAGAIDRCAAIGGECGGKTVVPSQKAISFQLDLLKILPTPPK
jgi:hypothetical protein